MAFRLKRKEEVIEGVQRIALEQIDKAIEEIKDDDLPPSETVHQVRKRCKKIRGLVRLVRPSFESTYKTENKWFRDAARRISATRDAEAVLESFDELMEHFKDAIDRERYTPLRDSMAAVRDRVVSDSADYEEKIEAFYDDMQEAASRVGGWELSEDGFDALADGVRKVYARGRKALREADQRGTTESFHQWRKRAKYLWYHCRLLRNLWQPQMKMLRDEADHLSDMLGDEHDLAVLRETIENDHEEVVGEEELHALFSLMDARRIELRKQALRTGEWIYTEKPKAFVRRLEAYWDVWRGKKSRYFRDVTPAEAITAAS